MTYQYCLIFDIVSLANLLIGIGVLIKNPGRILNASFFLFTLGISAWSLGLSFLYLTHNFSFDKPTLAGTFVMAGGFMLFARVFPYGHLPSKRFFLLFLPLAAAFLLLPFNLFISGISIENNLVRPINGPLIHVYAATILGYSLLGLYFFVRNLLKSSGRERIQMLYLALAISTFLLTFILFDILLPALGVFQFNLLGLIGSVAFSFITAAAIVRHQLLDIRFVIQRGLIYSILLTVVIGFYLLVITLLSFLGNPSNTKEMVGALITIAAGVLGIPFIEQQFRRVTDSFFFKGTHDYGQTFHDLSLAFYASRDFKELVAGTEACLSASLRAKHVRIQLGDSLELSLRDAGLLDRKTWTVPIMLDGKNIGIIEAGEKRSGDKYTEADIQFLMTFSRQAAVALSRIRLFEEVKQHAEELEEKVAERTQELRDMEESQRHMLMDITHGLQTPLAIFQTKLEEIKLTSLNDAKIHSAEQSLANFSVFVYSLLELARLEHGHEQALMEDVSMSELVADICEEIETIAAPLGVRVACSIAPDISMQGRVKQLREAFMNLMSNALKYQRTNAEKQVSISLTYSESMAVIEVRDSGIGISEQELPYIFDRFFRSRNAPYGTKGTGLGLAITKSIVEQHGGTITATSVVGEGTTIKLGFPVSPPYKSSATQETGER